jgi:D-alanyl-D-alanine carboxypeptidase
MIDPQMLADLGIPADYGRKRRLRIYREAQQLEDVEQNIIGRVQKLVPATARSWRQMKSAAAVDGVELLLVSGFRSVSYQVELFRKKLASGHDIESILKVNAAPGYSEHHTGKAVDIATPGSRPLTEEFETSAAFRWLQVHAGRFGFSMPYGRDNPLGIAYEPWHWSQLERERRSSKSTQP